MDVFTSSDLLRTKGYDAYVDYVEIKQHFSNPDFYWRRNKRKIKMESYLKRKDVKNFQHIVNKYKSASVWQEMMISSFICNQQYYVIDIAFPPDELLEFHYARMGVLNDLQNTFIRDIKRIDGYLYSRDKSFLDFIKPVVKSPDILTTSNITGISLETIAILDKYLCFTDIDTLSPIWNKQRLILKKYGLLLQLNEKLVKLAISNLFDRAVRRSAAETHRSE